MKNNNRRKNQLKTLNRSDFDRIFSSESALDDYTTKLVSSINQNSATHMNETRSALKKTLRFPKHKATQPFSLSALFPPHNVPIPVSPTPKPIEQKPSLLSKIKGSFKSTLAPIKQGVFLKTTPSKTVEPKRAPLSSTPITSKKGVVPTPKPAPIQKIKKDVPIPKPMVASEPENTPKEPVKTISSEAIEKRLQERQKKIQNLFDQKGSVS